MPFDSAMASSDNVPGNGHAASLPAEEEKILVALDSSDPNRPLGPKPTASRRPRHLAIASIICGISCVGIAALVYAMKAEGTEDPEAARPLRRKARRLSLLSIGLWVGALVFLPLLLGFLSYVIARAE